MLSDLSSAIRLAAELGLRQPSRAKLANAEYAQCWIDRVANVQRINNRAAAALRAFADAVAEANRYAA